MEYYKQIVDVAFAAARILDGRGFAYSWKELREMAEALAETEHGIDPTSLAEFYELHA